MKPPPHKTTPVHRSLGGGGSLFCGLKTLTFSLPSRAGLSRRNQTCLGEAQRRRMQAEAGRRRACRVIVKRRRKPFLSRRSVTKTEALVSVLGKFGGADQLRNAVNLGEVRSSTGIVIQWNQFLGNTNDLDFSDCLAKMWINLSDNRIESELQTVGFTTPFLTVRNNRFEHLGDSIEFEYLSIDQKFNIENNRFSSQAYFGSIQAQHTFSISDNEFQVCDTNTNDKDCLIIEDLRIGGTFMIGSNNYKGPISIDRLSFQNVAGSGMPVTDVSRPYFITACLDNYWVPLTKQSASNDTSRNALDRTMH
jgi:hypothetical protein